MNDKNIVLGITGASGAVYAVRLLEILVAAGYDVHLSISPSGRDVIRQELDRAIDLKEMKGAGSLLSINSSDPFYVENVHYHHYQDMFAPIASGSFLTRGMVICPCSGATLSSVANAASSNLIHRAAEVHLKERRTLVLVPRETPLSLPQLDNMRRAVEAGAVVLPASPGWYHGVETLGDLVDFVVARICDQLGIENRLMRRWGSGSGGTADFPR